MRKVLAAVAALGAVLTGASVLSAAPAQTKAPPVAAAPTPAGAPLTAQDAESWLDGYLPYALKRGGIVGAVVVVVKDGQVLMEKGYGYADLAKKTPVDPKTTLFRPGSVSKLYTWTAVMQLVEAGKIDLDRDINDYLDFKIPPRNGKPITMRNLMTHTPGFEETIKGLIGDDPNHIDSLEVALKRWTPHRVYDAGSTPAYSNYGAALAGYIVQRISGERFEDYVDNHIFKPLDMQRSSFHQPLQASLMPLMSKGYEDESGEPKKYEFIPMGPAGSSAISGDDMAHFMIAHLQDGRYGQAQILKPETAKMMHDTPLTMIPPLHRMELGFYEQDINGHKVIAHGGDTQYFHSDLFLFTNDNIGLYVSMNSPGKQGAAGQIRSQLLERFADRYLPGGAPDGTVDAKTAAQHAKMMVGVYDDSRRSHSSFLSVIGLLSELKVTANKDDTISVSLLRSPDGDLKHFREISPFVWREVNGHDRVAAVVKDGKVVRLSSDEISPFMVFDPAPAGTSSAWLLPALQGAMLALTLTLVFWAGGAIVRRRYGGSFPLEGARARGHRLMRYAVLSAFLAAVGWCWLVVWLLGGGILEAAKADVWVHLVQLLTLVGWVGGFLAALYSASIVWTNKSSWFAKLWSVVLVASIGVLLWTSVAYHLLGFGVEY